MRSWSCPVWLQMVGHIIFSNRVSSFSLSTTWKTLTTWKSHIESRTVHLGHWWSPQTKRPQQAFRGEEVQRPILPTLHVKTTSRWKRQTDTINTDEMKTEIYHPNTTLLPSKEVRLLNNKSKSWTINDGYHAHLFHTTQIHKNQTVMHSHIRVRDTVKSDDNTSNLIAEPTCKS